MIAKDNVTIGTEWRFGPDWPGQRFGAKTRRGTACRRPASKRNGRCRLHGGQSAGPKTAEGRAKIGDMGELEEAMRRAFHDYFKEDINVSEEIGVMLASSFDDKEFEDLTVEQVANGPAEYSSWNGRNC